MNKQLISIILPVFNGEDFLEETLKSIENQSYKNFEVIIINDASKDNTKEIAEKFCNRDARFKIFNNDINLKLPKSLNKGHNIAKGDLITWTSHDNILKPNFLKVLKESLLKNNVDFVYSDYDIINCDGSLKRKHNTIKPANVLFGNVVGASFLYKKTLFDKVGEYDVNLFLVEDYDFWLRACKEHNFFHVKANLYKYRLHENSLTKNISENTEFNIKHKNGLKKMYSNLFSGIQSEINYAELFFQLYYNNISSSRIKDLIMFRKESSSFFRFNKNELKDTINEKIRILLFNKNISRLDLVIILFSNPELLNMKYNTNKSLKLLSKIILH